MEQILSPRLFGLTVASIILNQLEKIKYIGGFYISSLLDILLTDCISWKDSRGEARFASATSQLHLQYNAFCRKFRFWADFI